MMAAAGTVSNDALQFGEDEVAHWLLTCSDEDLVRVCDVAAFTLSCGPTAPSGNSMMISKALAIAAVYVAEGAPRALRRGRRDLTVPQPTGRSADKRYGSHRLQESRPMYFSVGDDFIDFWAADPVKARAEIAKRAAGFRPPGPEEDVLPPAEDLRTAVALRGPARPRRPSGPTTPPPAFDHTTKPADGVRDALLWAVAEVERLAEPGLYDEIRYLRSKRLLYLRRGTTTVTRRFSPSKWNGTGFGIWIQQGMSVSDRELARWREDDPRGDESAGGFIDFVHELTNDTAVWQPAGAKPGAFSDHGLADLPRRILDDADDVFAAYADPLSAVRILPVRELNAGSVATLRDWALALGRTDEARHVVSMAIARRPIIEYYLKEADESATTAG